MSSKITASYLKKLVKQEMRYLKEGIGQAYRTESHGVWYYQGDKHGVEYYSDSNGGGGETISIMVSDPGGSAEEQIENKLNMRAQGKADAESREQSRSAARAANLAASDKADADRRAKQLEDEDAALMAGKPMLDSFSTGDDDLQDPGELAGYIAKNPRLSTDQKIKVLKMQMKNYKSSWQRDELKKAIRSLKSSKGGISGLTGGYLQEGKVTTSYLKKLIQEEINKTK